MKDTLQKYDELKQIGQNIWTMDGDWHESSFRRRMTVILLRSGGLLIHNAIRLNEEDYKKLEAIGKIEYVIVPNSFHASEAHHYKLRYPKSKLYVSLGALKKIKKLCPVDGVLPGAFGQNLRDEVDCIEVLGTRLLNETILYHSVSKTLITTDLVFNLKYTASGVEKTFLKWNKIDRRFGPSRIFKVVFVEDKTKVQQSMSKAMAWNFDRVIMNHGAVLETGGKDALRKGFAEIGISLG